MFTPGNPVAATNPVPATPRRLLSADLDGTIVFDAKISPADVAAVRRWRAAGNLFVVNTGRSIAALGSALAGSGLEYDYAVLYTGAVLVDQAAQPLRVSPMPDGVVEEVLAELGQEDGLKIFATTLNGDFILTNSYGTATGLLTLFSPGTLADLQGRTLIGIPFHIRDEALHERIMQLATGPWSKQVSAVRNQDFIDLVPAGHTKGTGLRELLGLLTGPDGVCAGESLETWSIGDSWNDIPMHTAADHSCAMPSSPPEVVQACEMRTDSLAELVERILGAEG
ncbi:sugar phosphate phosphatase [Actinomyces bovis]|uniref:Sugar phosphate phosphatase n=2 Tax=Actinomyces bovis TaxID=1658 RepID=A0ABY1VPQ3_9ACTO|nr:sugar phosphate phosphatase [Actinomyces bovis]VEG55744.1 sugar phosphate phosphatase [Actinomyces israelii]